MPAKIRNLPIELGDAFEKAMDGYIAELSKVGIGRSGKQGVFPRAAIRSVEREFASGGRNLLQFSREMGAALGTPEAFPILCWDEDDFIEDLYSDVIENHYVWTLNNGTNTEIADARELRDAWNSAPWVDSNGKVIGQ